MALTLADMRADIAGMLHESPEMIGPDDNLLDLGIDSMRLFNLVLKWQEAGARLEFADLAEHFTLAAWWRVVETRLTESKT